MTEKHIEKKLCEYVQHLGGECIKLSAVHHAGLPDRLVILPGGRVIFVEVKKPGGKLSRLQRYVLERLINLGCEVRVIDSLEDINFR